MSLVKKNIVANFAGSGWTALMGLLCIPFYIHFLGMESFGLVGVFVTIQGIFSVLDMGLSATLTRELARLSVQPGSENEIRTLARTLEVVYWGVAVFVGSVVIILAPAIAVHWVQPEQLSTDAVAQTITIMGLAMAFQWPVSFYSGGLMGLQRQILLNGLNILTATLRYVGAVLVLWKVSRTAQAYFAWQGLACAIHALILARTLWWCLPQSKEKPCFKKEQLARIWQFAAGMSGISLLSMVLMQTDKIILSKLVPLEMFGCYALAHTLATSLHRFFGPVVNAVYPRMTQLVALGDEVALKQLYHYGCQVMSVLILPAALVVAFFSREILLLYTQNPTTTEMAYPILSFLIVGTALNGLMHFPYALQLANGWTKLALYSNTVAVVMLAPSIFVMVAKYGAMGAAMVWVLLNSAYVFVSQQAMHRRLFIGEKWQWYSQDIGLPFIGAVLPAACFRLLTMGTMSQQMTLIWIICTFTISLLTSAMVTPSIRMWFVDRITNPGVAYGG